MQPKTLRVSQASVHLESGDEIFTAEIAPVWGSFQRQGTACANGIAKLPCMIGGKVLSSKWIDGKIPPFEGLREQQFEFELVVVFLSEGCIAFVVVRFDVVAFDFFENLVRSALLLVLDVDDWIDEVLVLERPNAIFPAKAGKEAAIVKSSLSVEIELGRIPCRDTVFELDPVGMKVVAGPLCPKCGEVLDLEMPRFFEVMVVSHDVGVLLCARGGCQDYQKKNESSGARNDAPFSSAGQGG